MVTLYFFLCPQNKCKFFFFFVCFLYRVPNCSFLKHEWPLSEKLLSVEDFKSAAGDKVLRLFSRSAEGLCCLKRMIIQIEKYDDLNMVI